MSVLYYADGTQWWCKRCETTVRADKDGHGHCKCATSPSPWEPVCRKCLRLFRNRKANAGFRRFNLPFSQERVYTLTLFGYTLEWARGSCAVDVSGISGGA